MPETVLLPQLTLADLTRSIQKSRERFEPDPELDLTHYVKLWREKDFWDGKARPTLTLILRTRGCTWDYQHGCTMCGYFVETAHRKVTAEQLGAQWERALAERREEEVLKIYTGGNFLDPAEVMPEVQRAIVARAAESFRLIIVESRPEYCEEARLRELADLCAPHGARLMIAIGLESSSDEVCDKAINKGYGFSQFVEAAQTCRRVGVGVKAYLLLKPPFLTEDETVEDIVRSIRDAAPHSDIVSVNPTNVQKHTLVESLWKQREYRTPWLWSVVEVLQRGRAFAEGRVLKSDPVGGGSIRGAHNCGRCDAELIRLIDGWNETQDPAFLDTAEKVECRCRNVYRTARRLEGFLAGGSWVD